MTAPILADALGPRGRRQSQIASVVALLLIAAALVVAYGRLKAKGQLEADLYSPFTKWQALRFLGGGLVNTLKVSAVAMVAAMILGTFLALTRLARSPLPRILATVYVEFFRGIPLYLLIIYCGFGLPSSGVPITKFQALAVALTLYNAAVLCEVVRAGIRSLDRGQSEAAFALGMGYWQGMVLVVVPQAIRRMVPAIVSQLVTLLKDSSLGVAIGYEELLRRSQIGGVFFKNNLQSFAFAALVYIAVNYSLSRLARRLEVRQRRRYNAGTISVLGAGEDLAVMGAQGQAATATT